MIEMTERMRGGPHRRHDSRSWLSSVDAGRGGGLEMDIVEMISLSETWRNS